MEDSSRINKGKVAICLLKACWIRIRKHFGSATLLAMYVRWWHSSYFCWLWVQNLGLSIRLPLLQENGFFPSKAKSI
jgi:hypothetical protein